MNFLCQTERLNLPSDYLLSVMDIIPSLAHPGAGEFSIRGYQEPMRLSRTHEWSLGGRGPFKMPLSVMKIPQDDALVNV